MAKRKTWLLFLAGLWTERTGTGNRDRAKVEEQQAVAEEIPAVETPAEPSAPKADPEAFAEDVVEVTETVVESEKAHSRSLPARRKKSGWKRLL